MKELYKIKTDKLYDERIDRKFQIDNVIVNGEKMDVFFCKNEKGIFAIAGQFDSVRWGRNCFYRIYFRKNFKTKDEGNMFYKKVKTTNTITF